MFFGSRRMGNLLQVCRRQRPLHRSLQHLWVHKTRSFSFPSNISMFPFLGEILDQLGWQKSLTDTAKNCGNNWCIWICWEQDSLLPAVVLVGVLPQQMMQTYVCFLFLGVDFSKFVSETAHVVKTHGYCMTCSSSSHSCKKAIKELLRRTIYINSSEVP